MMKSSKKLLVCAVLSGILGAGELVMLMLILCAENVGMLRFYTQDSNIFGGIASSVTCICSLIAYRRGETRIPYAARLLQYVSSCCLAVTFTVVVCILIPMNGGRNAVYPMLFEGAVLYMHFLCPILSVIITVFFTDREGFSGKSALWGLLPTLIYGSVTVLLNILGVMEGPYPFLRVRSQSVQMSVLWLVLIIGGAYGIAWGLLGLLRLFHRKGGKTSGKSG